VSAPQPGATPPQIIRNFCIIAHIDHGKSTLADRMLQLTGVVDAGRCARSTSTGWTSSASAASPSRARPCACPGPVGRQPYVLNMIDTPGHVDFTYEVSRSLAACEGAILLVDAAQGIEAQTLANLYLAMDADLHIIPVLNKIDLPGAQPEKYAEEIATSSSAATPTTCCGSRQDRRGRAGAARRDRRPDPAPVGDPTAPARALIFDSVYDTYRGVVTYVRVVDGALRTASAS
jgi:GTP-binding protein LepA